jgi:NADPH2:quinone reductase
VGHVDCLQTRGLYQDTHEPPFILGMEVAGRVVTAPQDAHVQEGDHVMGFTPIGGFADRVVLDPALTFPVPSGLASAEAAAMVLNYQTAMFALEYRGRLRRGEHILVHGATGGVGTAAVQVAKAAGARVTAVVSLRSKATVAEQAGADDVVVLEDGEWLSTLKRADPGGVDLIVDPVGGELFDDSIRALAFGGRLLTLGFVGGGIPQVKLNRLLLRNVGVLGVAWGPATKLQPGLAQELHARIAEGVGRGALRPLVADVLPLEQVASALEAIEARQVEGKLVLALKGR